MYEPTSESAEFCRRYDKNVTYFFLGHGVIYNVSQKVIPLYFCDYSVKC